MCASNKYGGKLLKRIISFLRKVDTEERHKRSFNGKRLLSVVEKYSHFDTVIALGAGFPKRYESKPQIRNFSFWLGLE